MHETSYMATPEFDATVAWKTHRYGDVLVDKAAVARVRETADVTINTLYAPMRRYPVCFSLLLYYDANLPMLD